MERGRVSSLQTSLLLFPAIIATAILSLPGITAQYAGKDLWISPIMSSSVGFLTVYTAIKLHERFPGATIMQSSEQIIGKPLGKVIGFIFLFFYTMITGQVTRDYSEFILTSFLSHTPQVVIASSMVLLCAYCLYGGIEVLGRVGLLLFPLFCVPIYTLIFFLTPHLQPGNMLPIMENGIFPPAKGAIVPAGWFAEFFLIAFLLPFVSDRKKSMKNSMITVFFVALTLVLVNLIVLFVMGAAVTNREFPLMTVARYVSVADFFENLEAAVLAIWIAGAFVKISLLYYAAVLATAQWFNMKDYRPIILPVGMIVVQFAYWGNPSTMTNGRLLTTTFPFISVFIQTLLPLVLLLLAIVMKKRSSDDRGAEAKK